MRQGGRVRKNLNRLHACMVQDEAATAAEYGILLALVALAIFAAVSAAGLHFSQLFSTALDPIAPK